MGVVDVIDLTDECDIRRTVSGTGAQGGGDDSLETGPEILQLRQAVFHGLDLFSGPWPWRLVKDLGYFNLNRQGGCGNPRLAHISRDADGGELLRKFALPAAAACSIALIRRPDRPQTPFQLAGHVVRRPGATDRDQPVLVQVFNRFSGNRFREENRARAPILVHVDSPGSGGFRREIEVACPDDDGDPGLKQVEDVLRNHGSAKCRS